ncbi:hypothetical protein AT49_01339 [Streptococcus equi subsp. zooepidemicus SzAM35]|nr:hypothetical protein AT49_01339 [Streptococcus equi subsp. zooepidemicus SzAM35]
MHVVLMSKRYSICITFLVIISRFVWFAVTGRSPFYDFIGTIFLGVVVLLISQKVLKKLK